MIAFTMNPVMTPRMSRVDALLSFAEAERIIAAVMNAPANADSMMGMPVVPVIVAKAAPRAAPALIPMI